jgi:hypothetical protein
MFDFKRIDWGEVRKWVLPVGILLVVFVFGKKILVSLGLMSNGEQEKKESDFTTSVNKELTTSEQVPSNTDSFFRSLADTIYNDLRYSALDDNKADCKKQLLTNVKNQADILLLQKYFGYRQEYFFFLPAGDKMNLQAFVVSNLDAKDVAEINNYYATRGITFRF